MGGFAGQQDRTLERSEVAEGGSEMKSGGGGGEKGRLALRFNQRATVGPLITM